MFRVELFRVNPITDQANQATNQANQDLERLDQVEDENVLSEKEIEILNLVRMQPSITQKEMANALDWNLASVKYYITKLKEKKMALTFYFPRLKMILFLNIILL